MDDEGLGLRLGGVEGVATALWVGRVAGARGVFCKQTYFKINRKKTEREEERKAKKR